MKNKVLKVAIIIMLIIAMTISDFIFVGMNVVYALQNSNNATNHENVKFATYFKTEDKEVSQAEYDINSSDMKLFIEVSVKNEGYFDGVITLNNTNFKLKQEKLSEGIDKIEGNTITLNRVGAGEVAEIEVGIEPIIEESYGANMLSKESIIKLEGTYKNSAKKDTEIEAERKVTLTLLAPSDLETTLSGKVITNKVMKIGEENKRIVQIELNSTVVDNAYPIKKTTFEINLPEGVESTEVISQGTYATNGEADKNLAHEVVNEVQKVAVENTSKDGKISWKKDSQDTIVATFILPENAEVGTEEYSVTAKVEFQGKEAKTIEKELKYNLTETKVGIIRTSVENKETIYKGKIYVKQEREYNTTTNIKVNYANLVEGSKIEEKTTYRIEKESEDLHANIEYKSTTIKKAELEKILGENGSITIKSGEKEIATITSLAEEDENGNIVIEYEAGIKELQIEITKAAATGIIRLNHTKVIKAEAYSKAEITALKYLVEQIKVSYNLEDGTVVSYSFENRKELGETKTVAELTEKTQTLSTAATNEQVKFAVTLRTDDEKYDLYKNPTITIKLPEGIKSVTNIKATPLHLANAIVETGYNSDTREIQIKLNNVEQTEYNGSNTNGYIEILADIELDEKVPNRQDAIVLTYSNEKAVSYANEGKIEAKVNISGHSGLVAYNYITNHNLKTNSVTSEEVQVGNLKMYQDVAKANFQIALVNNTGTDLSNVKVLGNFPVDGNIKLGKYAFENTIGATLESGISIEAGTATIYYTSNRTATNELENTENGWTNNLAEVTNPVLYMIVISNMGKSTNFIANYTMKIPENLQYNKDLKSTYVVEYSNDISSSTINAIPVGLETGKVLVTLEVAKAESTLENNAFVKAGEVIKYRIIVTNTGSNAASNVKVSALVPEGTILVEPIEDFEHAGEIYYKELENTKFEQIISELASGETKTLEYEVRVKPNFEKETIENQATVTYNENIEVKSNILTNKLQQGSIRVTLKRVAHTDDLTPGMLAQYYVIVENISNVEQKDIKMKFNMPQEDVLKIKYIEELETEMLETKNEWTISSIAVGQHRIYSIFVELGNLEEQTKEVQLSATATHNGQTYSSNVYDETVYGFDFEMKMTSPNEGEYLKTDDAIEYHIEIKNNSQIEVGTTLVDKIPEQLTIQKIEIDGKTIEENISDNLIYKTLDIAPSSTMLIKIYAIVNYDRARLENETITNIAKILYANEELATTESVSHIIESIVIEDEETQNPEQPPVEPENPEQPPVDPENPEQPPVDPENPEQPPVDPETPRDPSENPEQTEKKKYNISGRAWVDQNQDGEMNNKDTVLEIVKVKLLNVETNEFVRNSDNNKDLTAETNEEGYYEFKDILEGKYLVVFEYDKTLYKPTTYQKEWVEESRNSNVVSKKLTINGEEKEYATTNEITLNQNTANINMGLVFIKKFDIELDKFISKVIVQTSKNTVTYDYQNEDFAKVDINAKRMIGSTILVQYTIKVTNTGDVDAYVTSIADYLPAGLKFSSELNKDWYEAGADLYTSALQNIAIAPGESKEVNLILTKTKDNGNAELINNMAEIIDSYNIYGIEDINSEEANKNKDENDLGSADLMISIQTGTVFNYIALVISMLGIIGAAAYIIKKKVLKVRI